MKNYVVYEIIPRRNKFTSSIHQMELTTKLLKNSKSKALLYLDVVYKLPK